MVTEQTTTTVDTAGDDALGTDDLTALLGRLARRDVSPAELRAAAVARARLANEQLNAVTAWVDEPLGTEVAVPDDAPFAGIPTLLKDNEELTGYLTTQGSSAVPEIVRPRPARPGWRSTCSWVSCRSRRRRCRSSA